MLISTTLAQALNTQIGNEFGASLQYYAIGAHFHRIHLAQLAKLFFKQADEEREHAQKLLHYVVETGGELRLPAVKEPVHTFASAEEALQAALNWEVEVTRQIKRLMDLAASESDYLAQNFLQWFVDEQLEEVTKMTRLLGVVRMAGERNLLSVEAYLVHGG
ncbi:MAG TPA: ferritin [Gemmatimonas aurantiaca]|uniref:Ferritin n=2 Tax=Gemmatimonas aurantiaca TaxID=173480 RepID=C1AD17_GEMAT|nr:ferritin [Gemmatimonas aurantiaca]BAH40394.1 putative ferritin [Gemmatimonas aurantiaca T-27]HCT57596.1 ferritin [Gemmatimonas aurantiaca]